MKVENISKKLITDDNNNEITVGCTCSILVDDFPVIAEFKGITKKGAMEFGGTGRFENVTFRIMPKSVGAIYVQDR